MGSIDQHSGCDSEVRKLTHKKIKWPVGLMDKASASGAGDSRFESWAGHYDCTSSCFGPTLLWRPQSTLPYQARSPTQYKCFAVARGLPACATAPVS